MTNKIMNPWLATTEYGYLCGRYESLKDLKKHDYDSIFHAEPFEPIKLTKEEANNINHLVSGEFNLNSWYGNLRLMLSDDETAFLFLHRENWRDFVEVEPEKKYYLISRDAESIGNNDKYLNVYKDKTMAPYFYSENETGGWKTQFTQAEIDELGDRVKNLRKEEVK